MEPQPVAMEYQVGKIHVRLIPRGTPLRSSPLKYKSGMSHVLVIAPTFRTEYCSASFTAWSQKYNTYL